MPDKENVSPIPASTQPATSVAPISPTSTTTETPKPEEPVATTVVNEEAVDLDEEDIETYTKDKSFKSLLVAVPKRILELIIKIIGGKGSVLAIGTYLFMTGDKIPLWAWLVLVFVFIGGRYADKMIDRLTPKGTF